ncbi:MAG: AAA family ATPase, partial [Deltaproteobacteria bacterium]
GGRHIFFPYPESGIGCKTGLRPGIDVRGDGGYVIAPPSVIEGRRYEWEISHHPDETMIAEAPEWLLKLLDGHSIGATLPSDGGDIPSGQRNATLARLAGAMRRVGMSRDEIFASLSLANKDRCRPPLPTREVGRIADSIARYAPDSIDDEAAEDHGPPGLSEANAVAPFGSPAPIAEWLDTEPPPVDYLFENLLISGIVGGVFAQGGTGKTYLILCLMLSAALGQPSFRTFRPTRSMRVFGLLGEDPPDMIHRRIKSILGEFNDVDKALLADNLRLYCGRPGPLMKLDGNNPVRTEALKWLLSEVEAFRPALIIIDPKSMFYGLDENNNDHNTQWVNTLKELALNGATVLFCHHVTKALSGALELNGARGGSALADGSRFAANMRQLTEEDAKKHNIDEPWRYVEFKVTKNSYVPKLPGSVFFRFTNDGALEEVGLRATLESAMIDELLCSLQAEAAEGNFYTAREAARSKTVLPDATRKDRERIVRLAIDSGMVDTERRQMGKTGKNVLVVPGDGTVANNGQDGLDTVNV